jgi:hypothetical protein
MLLLTRVMASLIAASLLAVPVAVSIRVVAAVEVVAGAKLWV